MPLEGAQESHARARSDRPGVKVLVVEDSPTQAAQLEYVLEKSGYDVTLAENGREAWEHVLIERPDIVLSDIVMPEMDGHELCRRIKGDADLRDIPAVLVPTLSDPGDVIRAVESGADNFIVKPYVDAELLDRIQ